MSNDLTKKQPSFYPEVPMQQTGENNVLFLMKLFFLFLSLTVQKLN